MIDRISIMPAARLDLLDQIEYLEDKLADEVADRFLELVESSFKEMAENPMLGPILQTENPNIVGMRTWAVSGFPSIRIFYLVSEQRLTVIRVLHTSRDRDAELSSEF